MMVRVAWLHADRRESPIKSLGRIRLQRPSALSSLVAGGLLIFGTVGTVLAQPATPSPPAAMQRPDYGPPISLADARLAVAAAEAEATRAGARMVVTVVEPTGDVVMMEKMDGAQYGSTEASLEKAKTSARWRRTTKEFEDAVIGGRNAVLSLPDIVLIGGGVPLLKNGRLVGAIGTSGGNNLQDQAAAAAAAAALH